MYFQCNLENSCFWVGMLFPSSLTNDQVQINPYNDQVKWCSTWSLIEILYMIHQPNLVIPYFVSIYKLIDKEKFSCTCRCIYINLLLVETINKICCHASASIIGCFRMDVHKSTNTCEKHCWVQFRLNHLVIGEIVGYYTRWSTEAIIIPNCRPFRFRQLQVGGYHYLLLKGSFFLYPSWKLVKLKLIK